MANQSEAATTVDPQKWLGMLQRWCPAVRTAELVAFINLLIEAAGPRRVEWLDDLIVQADNQLRRPGTWKMNRLKQYAEAMSKNPRHLPRLRKLRGSPDFDVALKIIKKARHGMSADEVLPAFRQHRAITRGALVNVLISMQRRPDTRIRTRCCVPCWTSPGVRSPSLPSICAGTPWRASRTSKRSIA